jgi:signal transduction histidine kinase
VESYSAQIAAADCVVTMDASEPVIGVWDEFRIEQVVANLLTNALRYGAHKPIHVSVYVQGTEARVDVADNGIGISLENQKRIFQQFERVSAKHAVAGLGLGLFISDQIVAAHGGTITVDSEEGKGSLFRVKLPL